MGNLVYILIVIVYFIWQAQQARKKRAPKAEARQNADQQPVRQVREVKPQTVQERRREIFREVEMKNKPYARSEKVRQQNIPETAEAKPANGTKYKEKKKTQSPFLDIDMTKEEVAPEGSWTAMGEERFSKTGYDYNKAVADTVVRKVNLRDAIIGKIILDRPEW